MNAEKPEVKIVQLLLTPEASSWKGVLLGLGIDGVVYVFEKGQWAVCMRPPMHQDKDTAKLVAISAEMMEAFSNLIKRIDSDIPGSIGSLIDNARSVIQKAEPILLEYEQAAG